MKVLIATGLYPPEVGGPATYTLLLEKELPKRGIEVVVVPFRVSRQLPRFLRHIHYFFKVMKASSKVDVIFAQDVVSVGVPALLAARILGKRFFVRVPGDYAWEQATQRFGVSDTIDEFQHKKYGWKTNSLRVLQTIVTKYADTVITPSEYFRKLVIGWGVSSTKVVTIYNGVNLTIEPFKGIVKPAPLTIVSAGRLVPWKGFATLIEVMAQLPNWHLVILGDGPERKVLQGRIDALGLSNRVELLGNVTREEVFAWCRAADVFVLNTSFESFSFQIVEAMAAGVPVITTNTGSLPELITDGKEGVLVNPDDVPALVSSIQSVVKERVGWQQKTSAAIKKSEQFSVEHTADRLSALLK